MPTNFSPQYSVIIFQDDSIMPAWEYRLLDRPEIYAQEHEGIFSTVLVSREGFEALFEHPPEPQAHATPEERESLRSEPNAATASGRANKRKSPTQA